MPQKKPTPEEIDELVARVYQHGGSPEYVVIEADAAYEWGLIGPIHYRWIKLTAAIRRLFR